MSCRIETRPICSGLSAIRIENDLVALEILPELGAKIYSFVHKPSGTNLLWHNPRLQPAPVAYGAKFDDNWSGGWDELIPNDIPYAFSNGDVIPDHGEVWPQPAEVQVVERSETAVSVRFVHLGRVLPTRFEKELTVRSGESAAHLRYAFTNEGPRPVHFLWNIHPAMAVSPGSRLNLPARHGIVERWMNGQFEAGVKYDWPFVPDRSGNMVDLRDVPSPEGAVADHHYLPDVADGWYAVTHPQKRAGFAMVFPTDVFPHLWLFRAVGGWRGLNTLIIEVSNGYPNDLGKAIEAGRCGVIMPGATLKAQVMAIAYSGCSEVKTISPEGKVIPDD